MGGPLSVDAVLDSSLKVKGIITFDSPFFGLHPNVIATDGVSRVGAYYNEVSSGVSSALNMLSRTTSSSTTTAKAAPAQGSSSTMSFGAIAALSLAATAFTAYNSNSIVKETVDRQISAHTKTAMDSFAFLGPLWRVPDQYSRFEKLSRTNIFFRGLFLELEKTPHSTMTWEKTALSTKSTFTVLPPQQCAALFTPLRMTEPKDCIDAHMHLFDTKADPAYLTMLSRTIEWVSQCLSQ
jgi:hypothetical protein